MYRFALLSLLVACTRDVVDTGKGGDDSAVTPVDEDGDGFLASEGDCDDSDPARHPDAIEACNEVDDDCDGATDEDLTIAFWNDADGDGSGDPDVPLFACDVPEGASTDNADCDDLDAAIGPHAEEVCDGVDNDCSGVVDDGVLTALYADVDGDGYGDPTAPGEGCEAGGGYVTSADDCDDADPAVHPGAEEPDCLDPVDYNCDGSVGYADADADGWAACEECDDTDRTVSPDATETCNAIDDDCDGTVDDDAVDAATWFADADADGYGDAASTAAACDAPAGFVGDDSDCDDTAATVSPAGTETCNEVDDDCDGTIDDGVGLDWYADADGDGYGDAASTTVACDAPAGTVADATDCDDTLATVSPAGVEACNEVDDDCNGDVDDDAVDAPAWYYDGDLDGYGNALVWMAACDQPAGYSASGDDCNDGAPAVSPAGTETCNALDDDCDGAVDDDATDASAWYADADADGYGDPLVSTSACDAPAGTVADATDCDDTLATVSPAGAETCNDVDDDCDGVADDGAGTPWFTDADGDGYGDATSGTVACDAPAGTVADATDCDDGLGTTSPAGVETCNDVDDDCDGTVDDGATDAPTWYYDGDTDGYGNALVSTAACDAPAGYVASDDDCNDGAALASPAGTETCDGIDNDCDGTADEDGVTTWYRDVDGDGYGDLSVATTGCSAPVGYVTSSADCDDTRADVSPAAAEACDSVDNDCDGATDETGALTFYADDDGDGYGDASDVVAGCTLPTGYAANDDDCDDALTAVHPGATETCDGVDEDCDGTADNDAGDLWYVDADGDGYGTAGTTTTACTEPSGYAATDDDCNDASSSYSPAASEICDDSLDQDCDGVADDGCPDTVTHCGTISADETWAGEDVHQVTCDVYVQGASAPLLTIEDGATLEFSPGAAIYVGWSSYGELWVDGHTDGVTFTADATRPDPGDWDGLYFGTYDRGSWLEGATIEYGGGNGYGNVYYVNSSSTLTLLDSVITDSSTNGVYASNATIDMSGTTVSDNTDYGVYLTTTADLSTSGAPTFTGNTITGNGAYPITVPAAYVGQIDASNSFAGNTSDAVYVYTGTVGTTGTWYGLDVPYYIAGDVTIGAAGGMVFTVADGAELQFASGAALNVGTSSYTDFVVEGTTDGVTFTSSRTAPRAGDWDGIYIGTNTQLAEIDGATIGYGGANGYGNVYAYSNASAFEITNSRIHDSSNSGVYLSWYASGAVHDTVIEDNADYGVYVFAAATLDGDLSFTGNTVTGNGVGISLPAQEAGALGDDGAYTGNTTDDVEVQDDTVATSTTMRALDAYWHVLGDITVGGAARPTLTIEDGAELRFDGSAGLYVGTGNYGGLDVQGSTLGVVLTSAEVIPAAGDWDGIQLSWYATDSELRGCEIAYGGGNGFANLYLYPAGYYGGGATIVDDCVIRDSSNSGVYAVTSDELAISDTELRDNADYGLYMDTNSDLETTGEPTFTGNTVTGNGLYPLSIPITSLDQLDATSTFTGNGTDRIYVAADLVTTSGTWQDLDVPYFMNGDSAIYAATTPVVTIEAGTTLLFNYLSSLWVGQWSYGKIVATGTALEPIVFTSSQTVPAAGDWDGLAFWGNDTGSALTYVEVSYGGGYNGNVYVSGNASRVSLMDATIAYSSSYGIYRASSATPVLTRVTYTSNTSGTLY